MSQVTVAAPAVRAAVGRLDDSRAEPVDVVLPPQLVVRGTTGAPRSGLAGADPPPPREPPRPG